MVICTPLSISIYNFVVFKYSDCSKTTGSLGNKTKSRVTGRKRPLSSDKSECNEPNKKRAKIDKMTSLKYAESFLKDEIEKLRAVIETNTSDKKNKQCRPYEEMVQLTEKWTIATQEMIQAINDRNPDDTIPKLLKKFKINPKQVRWNEEEQEFE